jgi:acetyltransferase-like isoleucine patch superfamily enzyme
MFNRLLSKLAYFAPGGDTLRPWLHRMRGAKIGKNVWISQLVYIDELHPEMITIGDNSTIGIRTSIIAHIYWGRRRDSNRDYVVIEKNVYVGPHCVIMPNVRIGEGAVIKSGTTVTRNIPPFTFWGAPSGVPLGHVTVPLTNEHSYEEFVKGLRPIRKNKT